MSSFKGKDTIKLSLNLIRYDIPVLIVGKSSIGKSFTLNKIAKDWNMYNKLLFIGSEKQENIEGIPKITDRNDKATNNSLEYLKPYWFPNTLLINKRLENGKFVFNKILKHLTINIDYNGLYSLLNSLSELDFKDKDEVSDILINRLEDEPKKISKTKINFKKSSDVDDIGYSLNDIIDLSTYLTTVLGYGNFWLILDEIDKVDEIDKDKFAPLLHIVRERILKNYKLIEYNNGKGVGIPLSKTFVSNGYKGIIEDLNKRIDNKENLLDTRIIAIANESEEINNNNSALFRRFVQVIVEQELLWKTDGITVEQNNINKCIKDVNRELISNGINDGSLLEGLEVARISDINLQWKYNFVNKIINKFDSANNFVNDFLIKKMLYIDNWEVGKTHTYLYKVLSDNFEEHTDVSIPDELINCFENLIEEKELNDNLGLIKLETKYKIRQYIENKSKNELPDLINELITIFNVASSSKNNEIEVEKAINIAKNVTSSLYINNDNKIEVITEQKEILPVIINEVLKTIVDNKDLPTDFFKTNLTIFFKNLEELKNRLLEDNIDNLPLNKDYTKDLFNSLVGSENKYINVLIDRVIKENLINKTIKLIDSKHNFDDKNNEVNKNIFSVVSKLTSEEKDSFSNIILAYSYNNNIENESLDEWLMSLIMD